MTFHELDTIVLERDIPEHGLRRGDVGAVVHVLADAVVEVEFVRASGETQALVEVPTSEIRLLGKDDLLAARRATPPTRGAA